MRSDPGRPIRRIVVVESDEVARALVEPTFQEQGGSVDSAASWKDALNSARQAGDPRNRIVGRSPAMERLFDLIGRVAPMRSTVLISGATGTGKELVATAIHQLSTRATKPFVPVNCSALSETLLESELFGHVKGSFTGAIAARRGLFEEAAGGTLFLDEVSTLSHAIQVKLLRVLEERIIHRVGSSQSIPVDFRLIAATNQDLEQLIADGQFREDLYYRLNSFPIVVPPLRERRSDIPLLTQHFRARFAEENGVEPPPFSPATMSRMMAYDWPGNVRELDNFVERVLILHGGSAEIRSDPSVVQHPLEHDLLRRAIEHLWNLERLELEYIRLVLETTGGHYGHAAEFLGIDRRTLYRRIRSMSSPVAQPPGRGCQ
jgi:DNA-binding NtrC family response regulator